MSYCDVIHSTRSQKLSALLFHHQMFMRLPLQVQR